MFNYEKENGDIMTVKLVSHIAFLMIVIITTIMVVGPIYSVWSAGKAGEAELAQAEYNRQIIVRQAQAKKDAATLEAESEVIRAGGVEKANSIVAGGLGGPEGYLRYLYIHMLSENTDKQIIYIPTEAGLPILEANKR
jgi:hypothetical protein